MSFCIALSQYDHYNGTEEFEDIESTFGSSIPDNGMLVSVFEVQTNVLDLILQ